LKIENHPKVRKHMQAAQAAGKCEQCIHPWWDGICSCGKSGEQEARIAEIAAPLLAAEDRKFQRKIDKRMESERKKIDANLKPVKVLEGIWGDS
jgi:hypothetical protein